MEKPTVGMTVRRSGARLRSMAKAHGPLHVLLWQAREAQSALLAAASAQKTLFSDLAAWASSENRALNDVGACVAELSSLYTGALAQLALAYKSFRKEMGLVLEGERRCDLVQRKLHEAEEKRIKLRRQVLRAQNRIQTGAAATGDTRRSGDFTALQTQLAEAERGAERAHMEACATSREQEAVKLVVVKAAITKLSESHLKLVAQTQTIFEGSRELAVEVPEPPPPGDPVSCVRYSGYDHTKAILARVKSQVNVNVNNSFSSPSNRSSSRLSTSSISRPVSSSTPLTSPNSSSIWSPEPSAPGVGPHEPPPPYNMSYLSNASSSRSRSQSLSHCLDLQSSGISSTEYHENDENSHPTNNSSLYPNIGDMEQGEDRSYNNMNASLPSVSSGGHLSRCFSSNLSLRGGNTSTSNIMTPGTADYENEIGESPRYANFNSSTTASPARNNIF